MKLKSVGLRRPVPTEFRHFAYSLPQRTDSLRRLGLLFSESRLQVPQTMSLDKRSRRRSPLLPRSVRKLDRSVWAGLKVGLCSPTHIEMKPFWVSNQFPASIVHRQSRFEFGELQVQRSMRNHGHRLTVGAILRQPCNNSSSVAPRDVPAGALRLRRSHAPPRDR